MRRKDREITDGRAIEKFISNEKILRVAFYDDEEIYIVPVNYGFRIGEGGYVFYFHGAKAGRKFELARTSPKVGFEIDGEYALREAETACRHSANYRSVIGTGRVSLVYDNEEKRAGLGLIMKQATGRADWEFGGGEVDNTAVFRLDTEKISCKAR